MKQLLVVLAFLATSACTTVAPYEREMLATTRMRLDADGGESALVEARTKTREEGHVGAPGSSSGGAAGGCGCN